MFSNGRDRTGHRSATLCDRMNRSTPALNSTGWLLNMLWVAPAMVSRSASGSSFARRLVTALMCAGDSAPETSSEARRQEPGGTAGVPPGLYPEMR